MQAILLSAAAGILGTGFGGLAATLLIRRSSAKITCWLLSFAAGIMTSIACFGLIPKALEISSFSVSVLGLSAGLVATLLLNRTVDKLTETKDDDPAIHHTVEELYHEGSVIHNPTNMLRSGIIMLVAIGLHNMPEGLAIGAGGSHDLQFGIVLAIVIALHHIPEGMAIAAPLLAGGIQRWKVISLTALAGSPAVIGGAIGWLLGGISSATLAFALSLAGGAMLYVVFGEIIPQSVVMTKSRTATIITLIGIILGLLVARF